MAHDADFPPANPVSTPPQVGSDARREPRVRVSWPGRVQLPAGVVVDLRVRDISESGLGLVSELSIPGRSVLTFAMGVPDPDQPKQVIPVTGSIRTAYVILQARDFHAGAMWVDISSENRDLLRLWLRRLRR